MCGIVGAVSQRNVMPILLAGLKRLEYRGYDSAGVVVQDTSSSNLQRVRRQGKVSILEEGVADCDIQGQIGIGHTRWATHGVPSEKNAHPHIINNRIAVVHNGIIENYESLRKELSLDITFSSDTDTEVLAALIYTLVQQGNSLRTAVQKAALRLEGSYAVAVIDNKDPHNMIVARQGSPIVIGLGIKETFVGSDPLALQDVANKFIFLEEKDVAELSCHGVTVYDAAGNKVEREVTTGSHWKGETTSKGKYRHFMQKEIFEQPDSICSTLSGRVHQGKVLDHIFGVKAQNIFNATQQVFIIACGTSYYAGLVAKHWMESIAGIPCQVEIASEFRYRKRVIPKGTLLVTISQSGETADTIGALQSAVLKEHECYSGSLAICNVPESTLVRLTDISFFTHAGPEIGVASTKAFTTQLTGLYLLTLSLGQRMGMQDKDIATHVAELANIPALVEEFLKLDKKISDLAKMFENKASAIFLGRGSLYPVALEGALKLKEISYIHAEAYPSGELKHGPLALVDKLIPVVVLAPPGRLFSKIKSNIQEVQSRGGKIIVITSNASQINIDAGITVLEVPEVPEIIAPILYTLPLQLLAYHVAVLKGTDVDQPRNLAKSVTVE